MKRHESLVSLSRDHHDGLIMAQTLRKDVMDYEGMPSTVQEKVQHLQSFYQDELSVHFSIEEDILFPAVQDLNDDIGQLVNELISEHQQIKGAIASVFRQEASEDTLHDLGMLLKNHIRKEERHLFPQIQEAASDDLLAELGAKLKGEE